MYGGRSRLLMMACSCALAAGAAAGCGGSTQTVTETTARTVTTTATVTQTVTRTVTVRSPSRRTTSVAAPATTTSATPSTTTQPSNSLTVHDFSGNALLVTVIGVVPATPAPAGFPPTAGDRLVALSLTLTDTGPGRISSDADADATLTGTDGQTYTSDFDAVVQCTNFDHGSFTLLAGASATGCVVFQLPLDVTDRSVRFSLGDGSAQFNKR